MLPFFKKYCIIHKELFCCQLVYNIDHIKDTRTNMATSLRREVRFKEINDLFENTLYLFYTFSRRIKITFIYLFVCLCVQVWGIH